MVVVAIRITMPIAIPARAIAMVPVMKCLRAHVAREIGLRCPVRVKHAREE
jgi:hypothetical protein